MVFWGKKLNALYQCCKYNPTHIKYFTGRNHITKNDKVLNDLRLNFHQENHTTAHTHTCVNLHTYRTHKCTNTQNVLAANYITAKYGK